MQTERSRACEAKNVDRLSVGAFVGLQIEAIKVSRSAQATQIESPRESGLPKIEPKSLWGFSGAMLGMLGHSLGRGQHTLTRSLYLEAFISTSNYDSSS